MSLLVSLGPDEPLWLLKNTKKDLTWKGEDCIIKSSFMSYCG